MFILYKNKELILKRAFFYIALFIFISDFSFCTIISNVDSKGIWVSERNLNDSLKIDSLITFSKEKNLNKIFFKVRSNGEAFYQSELVPKAAMLDSLFDPLHYLLKKTEDLNIEIHAWINTYLLWKKLYFPENIIFL